MKQTILWLVIVAGVILAYALYQSRKPATHLNVEPHAAEEIEKAQRR